MTATRTSRNGSPDTPANGRDVCRQAQKAAQFLQELVALVDAHLRGLGSGEDSLAARVAMFRNAEEGGGCA